MASLDGTIGRTVGMEKWMAEWYGIPGWDYWYNFSWWEKGCLNGMASLDWDSDMTFLGGERDG